MGNFPIRLLFPTPKSRKKEHIEMENLDRCWDRSNDNQYGISLSFVLITVNAFDFVRCEDTKDPTAVPVAPAGWLVRLVVGNPFVACLQLLRGNYDRGIVESGIVGESFYRIQQRLSTVLTVHNYASAMSHWNTVFLSQRYVSSSMYTQLYIYMLYPISHVFDHQSALVHKPKTRATTA